MGSTVYANGLAVATQTSGHWAHSVPGDWRKVDKKVDTLLPNNVPSTDIYAAHPTQTKFASGFIWVEGTKAGPTSSPIDTWPGTVKPTAINSWATSKPGSGSNNVFAEARRVYCFSHTTLQNEGNSSGILDDKPGVVTGDNAGDGAAGQSALADGDGTSGSKGKDKGEDGKKDTSGQPPPPKQAGPTPTTPCTVISAVVTEGSRTQSEEIGGVAYLQVVSDAKVKFEGKINAPCTTEHPLWEVEGKQIKNLLHEEAFSSNTTLSSFFARHVAVWDMLAVGTGQPKVVTGVFKGHQGTETRVVHVFHKSNYSDGLKKEIFKGFNAQDFIKKFKNAAKFIGDVKVTALKLEATVKVGYAADTLKPWRVRLELGVALEGTILELKYKEYFDLTFLTAVPVVGQVLAALYGVNRAIRVWNESLVGNLAQWVSWIPFKGDELAQKVRNWTLPSIPLPQAFVDLSLKWTAQIGFKLIKFHEITPTTTADEKSWNVDNGEGAELGTMAGSLSFALGLSLGTDKSLFEAGGEVRADTGLEGKLVMWKATVTLKAVTLTGKLYFTYDLLRLVPFVSTQKERAKLSEKLEVFGLKPKGTLESKSDPWKITDDMVLWEKNLA